MEIRFVPIVVCKILFFHNPFFGSGKDELGRRLRGKKEKADEVNQTKFVCQMTSRKTFSVTYLNNIFNVFENLFKHDESSNCISLQKVGPLTSWVCKVNSTYKEHAIIWGVVVFSLTDQHIIRSPNWWGLSLRPLQRTNWLLFVVSGKATASFRDKSTTVSLLRAQIV